jgi:Kef-type K+ transport system membrane component KefB
MSDSVLLIITLSLIIALSPFIARLLKIPTTPVEIILGSLASYFHFIAHDFETFRVLADFGFLYLMFIAGTEVNIKAIIKTDSKTLKRGFLYLGLLYVLSFLFAQYFRFSDVFILIMPLISVGLIATLSKEFGNDMPWIQLSFIIGSIGEVMSIVLLTIASAVLEFGVGLELAQTMLYFALFMLVVLFLYRILHILFWWYPEISTHLMPHLDNKEQDIRLSMALLFVFISIMMLLDLELAFGAFVAGITIPNFFKHKEDLPQKLSSFGFGFVIPVFFIYIGSSFPLEALTRDGLIIMAFIIANVMILMRVIAAFVFVKRLKLKGTILFALSHSMPLTLLIAVATLAHPKSIDDFHYYAFILAALFEVIFSMIAIKFLHHVKD